MGRVPCISGYCSDIIVPVCQFMWERPQVATAPQMAPYKVKNIKYIIFVIFYTIFGRSLFPHVLFFYLYAFITILKVK